MDVETSETPIGQRQPDESIARPPLSVIVGTRQGWPAVRLVLDALRDQIASVGGEVVVVDGSGKPAPGAEESGEQVRWVSRPGESVFELREAAWREVRGEIIAITEDHCEPRPDWCAQILRAHAEHPDAVAIGGAVDNGTRERLLDWAAFLMTQSPFMAPFDDDVRVAAGAANSSYKRAGLEASGVRPAGAEDPLRFLALRPQAGDSVVNDDQIVVDHHQSMGFGPTSVVEFHNGRSIAGYRRSQMGRGDWARVGGASVLPLYRTLRSVRMSARKGRRNEALRSLPWQVWLQYCNSAGELVGYMTGPGRSPNELN